jgi:transcriptional regulator with XRE-family HTH domain
MSAQRGRVRYVDVLTDLVHRQLPWRITKLRDQHHLTKGQLARKTDLAPSTVSQIERGVFRGVRFETVLSLAAFFEVSLDYMAGVDHAGLVRAIALLGRECPECGKTEGHSVPECALQMKERGRSHAFIAARHQLTVPTVEFMLREEIRIRSIRAARRGSTS